MDIARESIKSVLAYIDESDLKNAGIELKRLSGVPIDRKLKLLIEGLYHYEKSDWNVSRDRFSELFKLYSLDKTSKSREQETLEIFSFSLFLLMQSKSKDFTFKDQAEIFEKVKSMIASLENLRQAYQENPYNDLVISIELLLHIIFASFTETNFEELISGQIITMVEMVISPLKAVDIFHEYYSQDDIDTFILKIGNHPYFRSLSYDCYICSIREKFLKADVGARERVVNELKKLVNRVLPTVDNSHKNVVLYKKIKPLYNELVLKSFFEQNKYNEAFDWLEDISEGKGLDFLRPVRQWKPGGIDRIKDAIANRYDNFDDIWEKETNYHFILQEENHTWHNTIDDFIQFHPAFDCYSSRDQLYIKMDLLFYYISIETYIRLLGQYKSMDEDIPLQLFKRIELKTDEFITLVENDYGEDIIDYNFPVELGEIFERKKNFDKAIEYYKNSNIDSKEIHKMVERCRFERDGFIYEKLKKVLRGLSDNEQKQLIGYTRLFKLEFKLRNMVDTEMQKKRGKNWFEAENNSELKSAKEECLKRNESYKKDVFYKEVVARVRLIDFATLPELKAIIDINFDLFSNIFKNKQQFLALLTLISRIRLDIAHARLIDDSQLKGLEDNCDQLDKVVRSFEQSN